MEITKEQFDRVYNSHLPSKFIKLTYKYFSTSTEKKDYSVKNTVTYTLGGLFLTGLLTTILNVSHSLIGIFVYTYIIILVVLVGGLFTAVIMNNFRIRKICKDLGIKGWEYNNLVSKYYSEG
jgi:hypothetical protein